MIRCGTQDCSQKRKDGIMGLADLLWRVLEWTYGLIALPRVNMDAWSTLSKYIHK